MKKEEYVETLIVQEKMVNVGIDDYGQCYYFEYVNEKDELVEASCGTYETDYKGYIEEYFTPEVEKLKRRCERYLDRIDLLGNRIDFLMKENQKLKEDIEKLY